MSVAFAGLWAPFSWKAALGKLFSCCLEQPQSPGLLILLEVEDVSTDHAVELSVY